MWCDQGVLLPFGMAVLAPVIKRNELVVLKSP